MGFSRFYGIFKILMRFRIFKIRRFPLVNYSLENFFFHQLYHSEHRQIIDYKRFKYASSSLREIDYQIRRCNQINKWVRVKYSITAHRSIRYTIFIIGTSIIVSSSEIYFFCRNIVDFQRKKKKKKKNHLPSSVILLLLLVQDQNYELKDQLEDFSNEV